MGGDILAVSLWVVEDPGRVAPAVSLAERYAVLNLVGQQLLPDGVRVNQYLQLIIWANSEV
jgi:hypothetical protein